LSGTGSAAATCGYGLDLGLDTCGFVIITAREAKNLKIALVSNLNTVAFARRSAAANNQPIASLVGDIALVLAAIVNEKSHLKKLASKWPCR